MDHNWAETILIALIYYEFIQILFAYFYRNKCLDDKMDSMMLFSTMILGFLGHYLTIPFNIELFKFEYGIIIGAIFLIVDTIVVYWNKVDLEFFGFYFLVLIGTYFLFPNPNVHQSLLL